MQGTNVSLEMQHERRLLALLREVDRELGRVRTAEELGVDRKTLWRCMAEGRLTPRLSEALERLLLSREASAVDRLQERVNSLENQWHAWTEGAVGRRERLDGMIEGTVKDGMQALKDEWAGEMRGLEERLLSRLGADGAVHGEGRPEQVAWQRPAVVRLRREYPELVTVEPAPDDEEVFGEAWPLIREWRKLRRGHPNRGRSLSWLVREERVRTLEVALLEKHGMTLPPETYPLRGIARNSQLSWRQKAVFHTRKRRVRRQMLRWVRRILTLGLWRR